ncbi:MAG TPA: T9SS type A sorting domain-containing protein [Flavisolibacter sp.]|jgi:hypothetical protein
MKRKLQTRFKFALFGCLLVFQLLPGAGFAQPGNNLCTNATLLNSATTCTNTAGTLVNATASLPAVASTCTGTPGPDVWYRFVAETAYPTITLSSIGANFRSAGVRLQLLSGTCAAMTSVACVSSTTTPLSLNTATTPGGTGLTVGNTYYIRVYAPSGTSVSSGTFTFNICVTDPVGGRVEYSRSYVNITKGLNGGTIDPGDILEMRATFVIFNTTSADIIDSLAYYDTLQNGAGLALVASSLATRTNEGKVYQSFTDAWDSDAGSRHQITGTDTAIRINMGSGATASARGNLSNTSLPSYYTSTCIIMVTYRVRVYAGYNTKINFNSGAFTYRDRATGVLQKVGFTPDSLIVYQSPGLCPNAVSVTNAVGVESNGTFGAPASGSSVPLTRNRGTTIYTPTYTYATFATGGGPGDYYYGITNNTSATYTTVNTWGKPDASGYRVFGLWDIIGDHTGAANAAAGNPPCNINQPVSPSNPCGYMMVVNSAYKTDTVFQYTVTNLCPNTYYEISAWFRNICYKCGCDVNGVGASSPGYIPLAPGDSSGVQPNLAFDVNGIDYYTTGNIQYTGTTPTGSDANNQWVKRGFTYITGANETSFTLTIRNNAPGGGGNDWALDDITVATCLPNMRYSPTLNPTTCTNNEITIRDTVSSYFNNYVHYKWQRSTDGGTNWNDIAGTTGVGTPVLTNGEWQYITSYQVPPAMTQLSNNGDRYRVVVATAASQLSNGDCQFTDGISIINLQVMDCGFPLDVQLLSFNARLQSGHGLLSWTTSQENEPFTFQIQKSTDGINFSTISTVNSLNRPQSETNYYTFRDPDAAGGKTWYRIAMVSSTSQKKFSRTILLTADVKDFDLINVANPFTGELSFDVASSKDAQVNAVLMTVDGVVLKKQTFTAYAGINSFGIKNLESLPAAVYLLQIQGRDKTIVRKVVRQ